MNDNSVIENLRARMIQLEATLEAIFENREVLTSDEWDSMERIFQSGMLGSASAKSAKQGGDHG